MTNAKTPEEVIVVRFFEAEPIEKAEAVFNIVSDKIRERLANAQSPEVGQDVHNDKQRRGRRAKHPAPGSDVHGEPVDGTDPMPRTKPVNS